MGNDRYNTPYFLFGTKPAAFLLREAQRLTARQSALCVADGEGRNSVFLAGQGLRVAAMDASGVAKARALAAARGVSVDFHVADIAGGEWDASQYDAAVAIFIQLAAPPLRDAIFAGMIRALAHGGLLLHGYPTAQVAHNTGGPPSIENLYTVDLP